MKRGLLVLLLTLLLCSACVQTTLSPTPTSTPTQTAAPTPEPVSTLTDEELRECHGRIAELSAEYGIDDPGGYLAALDLLLWECFGIPIPTSTQSPTITPVDKCYSFELDQWIFYSWATAICNDGTCSLSTGPGTCSYHGGVRTWLNK
jgi:hypothetical protein